MTIPKEQGTLPGKPPRESSSMTIPKEPNIPGTTLPSIIVQGMIYQPEGTTGEPQGSGANPQLQSVTTLIMVRAFP